MIISVSIAWMIMGLPFFLKKKLNLKLNNVSMLIYKTLFIAGCIMLLIGVGNLIYKSLFWYIAFVLTIMLASFYSLKTFQDWFSAQEVMDKLTNDDND